MDNQELDMNTLYKMSKSSHKKNAFVFVTTMTVLGFFLLIDILICVFARVGTEQISYAVLFIIIMALLIRAFIIDTKIYKNNLKLTEKALKTKNAVSEIEEDLKIGHPVVYKKFGVVLTDEALIIATGGIIRKIFYTDIIRVYIDDMIVQKYKFIAVETNVENEESGPNKYLFGNVKKNYLKDDFFDLVDEIKRRIVKNNE